MTVLKSSIKLKWMVDLFNHYFWQTLQQVTFLSIVECFAILHNKRNIAHILNDTSKKWKKVFCKRNFHWIFLNFVKSLPEIFTHLRELLKIYFTTWRNFAYFKSQQTRENI